MKNNGGPAFPFTRKSERDFYGRTTTVFEEGMSLRDYAAINADIPWNAVLDIMSLQGIKNPTLDQVVKFRSEIAYLQADAMLEARK